MTTLKIGAATAARIEETYEPNFKADKFFPDWDAAFVAKHMGWLAPDHYVPETGYLKLSVHSWLLTIGGKRISRARTARSGTCSTRPTSRGSRPRARSPRTSTW